MRTLKVIEHVSLDGVMQHTADDDGFPHEGWNVPYRTPEGAQAVFAEHGDRFDLLLGRRTYDRWSEHYPTSPVPIAGPINAATKFVVTHRPATLGWGPAEAVTGDLVTSVMALKATDGPDLLTCGSSTLVVPLLEAGLIDAWTLIVYPLLLGTGTRLFVDGTPPRSLEPLGVTTTPTGVILARFGRPGPLRTA